MSTPPWASGATRWKTCTGSVSSAFPSNTNNASASAPWDGTFRPNLLATTSFDGSIATTYKRTVTDTVCDNTRELALAEVGQEVKVRHSRNSHAQLGPARQALAMVHTLAKDFAAEIAALCAIPVKPAQWRGFLDRHVPRTDPSTSRPLKGRALTHADNKRARLDELYQHDPRVAPWTGTAHGVLQAVKTYSQHEGAVRGDRAERNSLKTVTGEFADVDRKAWQALKPVLAAA